MARGQNDKSMRKSKSLTTEAPLTSQGFKVHHKATLDDVYIDLANVVKPAGADNPSVDKITSMRLKDFEDNWTITSNKRGPLMSPYAFTMVTNSMLKFAAGAEALVDEVFTIQYFN